MLLLFSNTAGTRVSRKRVSYSRRYRSSSSGADLFTRGSSRDSSSLPPAHKAREAMSSQYLTGMMAQYIANGDLATV